jgi:hypothetical protein
MRGVEEQERPTPGQIVRETGYVFPESRKGRSPVSGEINLDS